MNQARGRQQDYNQKDGPRSDTDPGQTQGAAPPRQADPGQAVAREVPPVAEEAAALRERLEQLERYRHMVDLNPQATWIADEAGRLLDFSPRWLELTGLTREQALTTGWTDVPHPADLPNMLAAWEQALATGTPLDLEHRIRVADSSYRWMRTRAFPVQDAEGKIVRWQGFTEDIEERVRAEKALRASEARYRSIVETVQEGVWIVDADYRTTFVNARMADMLGYTRDEMAGRPVFDFMEPEVAAERQRQASQQLHSGQYDARLRRKDGDDLWVIVSSTTLTDEEGGFAGAIALLTDITDRRRWEMDRARLAAIVESSEDAIVSKDLNGIVTSWNAAAERLYGWKAEDIIGRSKGLVIPPDQPDELANILRRVRAGKKIEHYETRRMRKDGAIFDVAISVSPVKDTKGEVIGAATIVRDITERKRSERELQRKREEVEALNERLRRAMRETHHRVKNNLQIVGAMIDMQTMEYLSERMVPLTALERLGKHVRTLAVVHDLLTMSVREDEDEQFVSSKVVVGRLLGLLEQTSGNRTIRSHVQDMNLLSKQAVTLSLTINELVSNAVKHATGEVDVTLQARDTQAELMVCDDGRGFPAGFDPITHANLGLELVLGLVDSDLKGHASFENGKDSGACVRVIFPLPRNGQNGDEYSPPEK